MWIIEWVAITSIVYYSDVQEPFSKLLPWCAEFFERYIRAMENHQQKPFISCDALKSMVKPSCQAQVTSSRRKWFAVLSMLVIESNDESSLKLLRTFMSALPTSKNVILSYIYKFEHKGSRNGSISLESCHCFYFMSILYELFQLFSLMMQFIKFEPFSSFIYIDSLFHIPVVVWINCNVSHGVRVCVFSILMNGLPYEKDLNISEKFEIDRKKTPYTFCSIWRLKRCV